MKIEERGPTQSAPPSRPTKSFKELLRSEARPRTPKPADPPPVAKRRAASVPQKSGAPRAHRGSLEKAATLQAQGGRSRIEARAAVASRAHGEVLARAHAQSAETSRSHADVRVRDGSQARLVDELLRDAGATPRDCPRPPSPKTPAEPAAAAAVAGACEAAQASTITAKPVEHAGAEQRAEAIAALVERIEASLRGERPSLTLALGDGAAAASVEIVRVAQGEVAVRIEARGGRGEPADAKALRTALAARGIKVRSVEVVRR